MSTKTLAQLSEKMRRIDVAMLSTHTTGGHIAGRPMSNNGEVEYDGTSYYYTWEESRTVQDIQKDPRVGLAFQGGRGFSVAVEGQATLVRDRAALLEHWTSDLDEWFKGGVDTPGIVMIQVTAERIHYWDGEDDGELKL